jgi:hypothetical protein
MSGISRPRSLWLQAIVTIVFLVSLPYAGRLGATWETYAHPIRDVSVHFKDGSTVFGDLVIAFDGTHTLRLKNNGSISLNMDETTAMRFAVSKERVFAWRSMLPMLALFMVFMMVTLMRLGKNVRL